MSLALPLPQATARSVEGVHCAPPVVLSGTGISNTSASTCAAPSQADGGRELAEVMNTVAQAEVEAITLFPPRTCEDLLWNMRVALTRMGLIDPEEYPPI